MISESAMQALKKIAVIVPYYQVEAGILARALRSISNQDLSSDVAIDVYIIDDTSPHPPDGEITEDLYAERVSFHVFRQRNGGPGAARNCGLDQVKKAAAYDYVAFLDSDDEWAPGHLSEALKALDHGYDFYFCDNMREGTFSSYSAETKVLADTGALLRDKANFYSPEALLMGFPAFSLIEEVIDAYLCQTSCVVVRAHQVENLRFDVELRSAGEDHMYWIGLMLSGARPIISWARNVKCGRGVNVFFDAFDWNKIETLDRVGCLALFSEKLSQIPPVTRQMQKMTSRKRRFYREAYSYLIIRALLKRQEFVSNTYKRFCQYDRLFPIKVPILAIMRLLDRNADSKKF